jgi:hypothetical protein
MVIGKLLSLGERWCIEKVVAVLSRYFLGSISLIDALGLTISKSLYVCLSDCAFGRPGFFFSTLKIGVGTYGARV